MPSNDEVQAPSLSTWLIKALPVVSYTDTLYIHNKHKTMLKILLYTREKIKIIFFWTMRRDVELACPDISELHMCATWII